MKIIIKMSLLIISLLLTFFISCKVKRIPMPNECTTFNPYKANDILVFKSNFTGITDTVFINELYQRYSDDDMPKTKVYMYFGISTFIPSFYRNGVYDVKERSILTISRNIYNMKLCDISFHMCLNNDLWFLSNELNLSEVYSNNQYRQVVMGKEYNDVILISNYKKYPNDKDATQIYWSFKEGYVKLVKANGEEYNLVAKYNDKQTCDRIRSIAGIKLIENVQSTDR